jgi:hypothetical protein
MLALYTDGWTVVKKSPCRIWRRVPVRAAPDGTAKATPATFVPVHQRLPTTTPAMMSATPATFGAVTGSWKTAAESSRTKTKLRLMNG